MILPKSFTTVTSLSKIIAGILFIILPLLGFWLGREYEKIKSQECISYTGLPPCLTELKVGFPPQTIAIPTSTPDETVDWKTYTNNELGFSLRYPNNYTVEELKPLGVEKPKIRFLPIDTTVIRRFSVSTFSDQKKTSLEDFAKELYIINRFGQVNDPIIGKDIFLEFYHPSKDVSFLKAEGIIGPDLVHFLVEDPEENEILTVEFEYYTNESDLQELNQILSTFRLLEEESIPPQVTRQTTCELVGGKWISEYFECEGIDEQQCTQAGGVFDECSSPCRHDPNWPEVRCIESCTSICGFTVTNSNDYCVFNTQCRCREFTGSNFTDKIIPGACNLETKRCQECFYY